MRFWLTPKLQVILMTTDGEPIGMMSLHDYERIFGFRKASQLKRECS
jgi:hypothetical protein